jgi:hypothetical protein
MNALVHEGAFHGEDVLFPYRLDMVQGSPPLAKHNVRKRPDRQQVIL